MKKVSVKAKMEGGNSERLETELIPEGTQLAVLYGICGIGTHDTRFGLKEQVRLAFEFPEEKREFYAGDGEKPCVIFNMPIGNTFFKKSKLRLIAESIVGTMSDKEAEDFDLSDLIGKPFVAGIEHTEDGKYANIKTYTKLDNKLCKLFDMTEVPETMETVASPFLFFPEFGFDHENLKDVPKFIREQVKESEEGKTHSAQGGTFAEPEASDYQDESGKSTPKRKKRELVMIDTSFTYEQFSEDWTDEQLVESGKARWKDQESAPTKPISSAPTPPASGPTPPTSSPTPPSAPKEERMIEVLRLKDGSVIPESWYAQGWTKDTLLAEGHGQMIKVKESELTEEEKNDVPF